MGADGRSVNHALVKGNSVLKFTVPEHRPKLHSHLTWQRQEVGTKVLNLSLSQLSLEHLSDAEAGDWLLNSWSGALTRMKAVGNGEPLRLFVKTTFNEVI